jgi:outer membrane protein OmpA-like peptidoglycan-associated protein
VQAQAPASPPAPAPEAQTPAPAAGSAAGTGDQAEETTSRANDKATTELASLKSGFGAKDLIAALNDSIVNFASGSAEVPAKMDTFLKRAAEEMKLLPRGHVLEIAGYTDSSGNPEQNVALSQKRAEAVREALIKAGADPDMLVAKGYGSADPIASNDTPEGRMRNRRIEYHVIKTP